MKGVAADGYVAQQGSASVCAGGLVQVGLSEPAGVRDEAQTRTYVWLVAQERCMHVICLDKKRTESSCETWKEAADRLGEGNIH